MACFNEYYCPHCGFSIQTENSFYYRLMSGYWMTVVCTKCKTIHRVIPPRIDTNDPEGYLYDLKMLESKSRESRCPKCGARGKIRIWEPSDGCPICKCELVERPLGLLVD